MMDAEKRANLREKLLEVRSAVQEKLASTGGSTTAAGLVDAGSWNAHVEKIKQQSGFGYTNQDDSP